jgi:hypothetical protein
MTRQAAIPRVLTPAIFEQSRLGTHHGVDDPDPLLLNEPFPHRATFLTLGFAVQVETNAPEILTAATSSWGEPIAPGTAPALTIRLGVRESAARECPPAPSVRMHGHLLSMIADAENFLICDLRQSSAFGWVNTAALRQPLYLRYHALEAAAMCLLSTSRVTPLHAACVSFAGHGFLFCGVSGAGKSTLAYACARAGWTYTSDDASYLLWHQASPPSVRGNAQQVRFRPSATELFPEIQGRRLTPRAEGKPSIEVRTAELPALLTAQQAQVHSIVVLNRQYAAPAELTPLGVDALIPFFETSLYPFAEIREPQLRALESLLIARMYSLRYSRLPEAITLLEQLAQQQPPA